MSYIDLLKGQKNIACVGLDPVLEKIPLKGKTEEVIVKFYTEIINEMKKQDCLPGAFKPNIAFFEQYGMEGLGALKKIISDIKKTNVPLILDAKRGDVDRTSSAYAKAAYDNWKADAVTVAPYMGEDSVKPFIVEGKGQYILCRTSNPGGKDFQDLDVNGKQLYMRVAEKIVEWAKPGTGAVVGATQPDELKQIATFFKNSGKEIPLLIPGVGKQGGGVKEVIQILKEVGYDLSICRINSSSGINYAGDGDDYAEEAVKALKTLIEELEE